MVAAGGVRQSGSAVRSGRTAWIGLAVLTLPMLLAMLDNGIIFLALPRLTTALHLGSTESLWIADIYGFLLMGSLVTVGRVGDRIGHRRTLLIGAGVFAVVSLLAAFATSAPMLILARALLGVAGASINPCIMALVKEMFPDPRQMATAFSVTATAALVGMSIGPAAGGFLLNWFWPGSVFLIGVPVMASLVLLGPFLLPETRNRSAQRLDFVSAVMWLAAVLPTIYGLTTVARNGWTPLAVVLLAVGLALVAVFMVRQRRLRNPLLDTRLFGVRAISVTLLMYVIVGIIQSGNGLVLTQHVQLVEGYSPLATALWMTLPIITAIIGVHLSTMLVKRIRPRSVLAGGLLIAAAGTTVLTLMHAGGIALLAVGLCVVNFGTSAVGVLSNQLVMHAAPADRAGSAAGLSATAGTLSTALGIAVFGSLTTVFYVGNVHVRNGVPAASVTAANETIAAAVDTAHRLPPVAGEALLAAARHTFNTATTHIAVISLMLFLGLAALVARSLVSIPPIGGGPHRGEEFDGDAAESDH